MQNNVEYSSWRNLKVIKNTSPDKSKILKASKNSLKNFQRMHPYPLDIRTKNVHTKDAHKRTFIFDSIWKHGKTCQLERLVNIPMKYVLKTSFSRPSFFFSLTHLKRKTTKISTNQSGFGKAC